MKVGQSSSVQFSGNRWRRPTEDWVSLCCALFFLVHDSGYFSRYIDFVDTHFQNKTNYLANFNSKLKFGVVLWQRWMRHWGHEEQTLTFLHAALSTWGQTANFLSVQLPPTCMKGSDKTDQDFKVGISNEDRRVTTDSGQSGSSPVGTGRLDYFFCYFFYCKCMDNRGKL